MITGGKALLVGVAGHLDRRSTHVHQDRDLGRSPRAGGNPDAPTGPLVSAAPANPPLPPALEAEQFRSLLHQLE